MKRILSLLTALLLLLSLSPRAFAEEDAEPEELPPEYYLPELPKIEPVPAPPPEKNTLCRLLDENSLSYEVDLASYYLAEMAEAAAAGDTAAGRAAEECRAAALAAGGGGEEIAFDDLYLLARVIDCEAGSDWLPDDFRLCVGEVVLNRVASPEFPDTLREVVYQRGQYNVVNTARFAALTPRRPCVDAALRLLQGERRMVPAVVFQSDSIQGELFTMYADRRLGNTYFCLSERLELYP